MEQSKQRKHTLGCLLSMSTDYCAAGRILASSVLFCTGGKTYIFEGLFRVQMWVDVHVFCGIKVFARCGEGKPQQVTKSKAAQHCPYAPTSMSSSPGLQQGWPHDLHTDSLIWLVPNSLSSVLAGHHQTAGRNKISSTVVAVTLNPKPYSLLYSACLTMQQVQSLL